METGNEEEKIGSMTDLDVLCKKDTTSRQVFRLHFHSFFWLFPEHSVAPPSSARLGQADLATRGSAGGREHKGGWKAVREMSERGCENKRYKLCRKFHVIFCFNTSQSPVLFIEANVFFIGPWIAGEEMQDFEAFLSRCNREQDRTLKLFPRHISYRSEVDLCV